MRMHARQVTRCNLLNKWPTSRPTQIVLPERSWCCIWMAVLNPRAACDCSIAGRFESCTLSEDATIGQKSSKGLRCGVQGISAVHTDGKQKTIAAVQARRQCPGEEAERSDLTLSCRRAVPGQGARRFRTHGRHLHHCRAHPAPV